MNAIIKGAVTSRRFVFAAVTVVLLILFFNAVPSGSLYDAPEVTQGGEKTPEKQPAKITTATTAPLVQPYTSYSPPPPSQASTAAAEASIATEITSASSAAPLSTAPSSSALPSSKAPSEPKKIAVLASLQKEDTSWLAGLHSSIQTAVYIVDNSSALYTVPKNKAHEAMVYLTYLIDHYDSLPDTMLFLHAHKIAWHNPDLLGSDAQQVIESLSSAYVKRAGYMNVRCHWDPGCPTWMHPLAPETDRTDVFKPEELELAKAFKEIFPGEEVPEVLAQPCCAQFALSKEAALKIPLEKLKSVRQWVFDTTLDDQISGRIFEYLWQYLFTGKPISCPRMDLCYCDGFGVCFGGDNISGEKGSQAFFATREEQRKLQMELRDLTEEKEVDGKKVKPALEPGELEIARSLEHRIKDFQDELDEKLRRAKKRGQNPELRAKDCGREWKEGDGF